MIRHRIESLISDGVLAINDGYRAKNSELGNSGLPFARASNLNNGFQFEGADRFPGARVSQIGQKVSKPGDVVFTSKGTVGRFGLVGAATERFVYSPQLCFWRVLDEKRIDSRWLYYWMHGREFFEQYSGVKGQTDMADYVNLRDQRRMSITLPHISLQRAVARVVGALDDKIDLNRRTNETLENIARAIFKSWFVDFDPVRAKAEGRQHVGMDAETAALFPERLTESDVGQIPRGWRVGSLLEHAMLLSGGTPKTSVSEYWNGTIPWASAADVSQCGECFLVQPERSITRRGLEESSTKLIPAFSTVVVARGATTGRMCLLGKGMAMNQTCYALRSKSGGDFYLYCRARHEVDDLVHAAHGSVFDTITTSTFEASRVLLPPEAAIRRFDEVVEPSFRSILIRQEESRNLTEIRDTLLPKLLSGELRIRDAEKMVEAHV